MTTRRRFLNHDWIPYHPAPARLRFTGWQAVARHARALRIVRHTERHWPKHPTPKAHP